MNPAVLVLAGHDPTGGAGVDADREAVERLDLIFCPTVTAHTEQDGVEVTAIIPRPVGQWRAEALEQLLHHSPRAVKTGLLPGAEHVQAACDVIEHLLRRDDTRAVVDPVLAASGGREFLDDEGIEALRTRLLPLGVILTPNVFEAARLVGTDPMAMVVEPELRVAAAEELIGLGAEAILLKGGHGSENPVRDLVLVRGQGPVWLERPRVKGPAGEVATLHGSGCRYASTVAAALAFGAEIADAAQAAGDWVRDLIVERGD